MQGLGDDNMCTQNQYTPAPLIRSPRVPIMVLSLESGVGIYDTLTDNIPYSPSSSSSDASQPSLMSTPDESIPLYSQVDVKPQPISVPPVDSCVAYAQIVKTQGANVSLEVINLFKILTHYTFTCFVGQVVCYGESKEKCQRQLP